MKMVYAGVLTSTVLASVAAAAPVSWTGLGDGVNWSDPLNWSGNALPGAADDVTVNVATNPSIVVTGVNPVIRSLTNAESLQISAGATFSVTTAASSTAPVLLAGGTVAGGAWTFTGGGMFQGVQVTQSTLNNVAVTGEIALGTSSRVQIRGTTTFTTVRLRGSSSSVIFDPGYVLNSQIISDGTATGSVYIEMTSNGLFTVGPTGSIVNAATSMTTLNVMQAFWVGGGGLDVRGTITNAAAANRDLNVNPRSLTVAATGRIENVGLGSTTVSVTQAPETWTSAGTLAVSSGLLTLDDGWTNTGTLSVTNPGRLDLAGSFTSAGIGTISRSGGTIAVRGQWNNASGFTLNATTGSFLFQGGAITGGTLNVVGGNGLEFANSDNQLVGVNYGGEILLADPSDRVRIGAGTSVAAVRLQNASTSVGFASGAVISYPVIAEGSASGTRYVEVSGNNVPLTIAPGGSITLAGDFASGQLSVGQAFWFNSATTITNNGLISSLGSGNSVNRTLSVKGATFVNNATVSSSGGGNLEFAPTTSMTNAGTISPNGGTTTIGSAWSSTGTIAGTNATLSLGGTFSTASARTVSRTGGTVDVAGVWDNSGQTFLFAPALGDWNLRGGTVRGGTIDFAGSKLVIAPANNTIDGVTFLDEVSLDAPSSRSMIMGATQMPTLRIRGASASVSFAAGTVVNFPVVFDMPANGTSYIEGATGNAAWTIGPSGSISTAPTNVGTPNIGSAFWFARAVITNQGSISMSTAGRTMTINPLTFTNTGGSVSATGGAIAIETAQGAMSNFSLSGAGSAISVNGTYTLGGALNITPGTSLTLQGSWSNTGTINLNAGTLNLDGTFSLAALGAFTNAGGTVNIVGTLNNTGNTLALTAATGSWRLAGGTISGGTVTQNGATLLVGPFTSNTLANVTLPQELALTETSSRVRLAGTASAASYRLAVPSSSIAFPPGAVINTTIRAEGAPGSRFIENGEPGNFTLGPSGRAVATGASVTLNASSFWYGSGTFTNQGVFEKIGSGTNNVNNATNFDPATFTLTGGTWRGSEGGLISFSTSRVRINNATVELSGAPGGLGDFASLRENNGRFALDDNRDGNLGLGSEGVSAFINRGVLKLGTGSRLQMGANGSPCTYTQTAAGTLDIELGGNDAATGYGSLRVFGEAVLDGTIRAAYVNGFPRACGQIFTFVDANTRTGQFSTTDLPEVDEQTIFLLFYGGADARFSVSARADFNQDGFLDFFDYNDFVGCFEGDCPPGLDADFNRDGFVDFFDYADYVFRFEAGCE